MIHLTFPDGARRDFASGITGFEIAKGISPSLAKRTVAMALDGVVTDLADPIEKDAKIEFLNREDPRALELIRHDAAHVMAEAVQSLWPGTQVTIGPAIEDGEPYPLYGAVLVLLVLVELIGGIGGGSQRWLPLGPFVLQPSELMKPAIVLVLASFYSNLPAGLTGSWRAIVPAANAPRRPIEQLEIIAVERLPEALARAF